MFRAMTALVALGLLATPAPPATAQEAGGVRPRGIGMGPVTTMERIGSLERGCPLSKTNVAVGVNRALATGAQARQQLVSQDTGCRPLVSTQVTAGVNLGLGNGSVAEQSISARMPSGLLGSTNVVRGVNIGAGTRTAATQRLLGQIGR
ncbi:conserved exported protein of unknown function [Rhodovastum atsumiense]|uniref:Uncharacterized protein n=1 Tax=Rhodovastum atsumiense TaxID=504468 RepID=A0A5M6INP1_9PROT|nr:hypothetical protein [Rhodovastum atsumiense]KAA5609871.1 hypothetical protein F1189_22030 [Rhodovastum atsumiense]CAH2602428.1 conserved exported protein of unknown function [Rhodovastum atsumiense]